MGRLAILPPATEAQEPTRDDAAAAWVEANIPNDVAFVESERPTLEVTVRPRALEVVPILSVLSGPGAGRTFRLTVGEHIIGRERGASIVLSEPTLSREHAKIIVTHDGSAWLEDLASSNGTYARGKRVGRLALRQDDVIQLGPHVRMSFSLAAGEEVTLRSKVYQAATRDALTGCWSRAHFARELTAALATPATSTTSATSARDGKLFLLDLDHFKVVNDTHGHLGGDAVLREFAERISALLADAPMIARWGGEEFAIFVPQMSEYDARNFAEALRTSVAGSAFALPGAAGSCVLTTSIGYAMADEVRELPTAEARLERLIELADARLYRAKAAGRNRVHGP
jgi:diguanylate cyclase (GGDEF)-like protein